MHVLAGVAGSSSGLPLLMMFRRKFSFREVQRSLPRFCGFEPGALGSDLATPSRSLPGVCRSPFASGQRSTSPYRPYFLTLQHLLHLLFCRAQNPDEVSPSCSRSKTHNLKGCVAGTRQCAFMIKTSPLNSNSKLF